MKKTYNHLTAKLPTVPCATCKKKDCYEKERHARGRARIYERTRPGGRPLRVYKCGLCPHWHLTSMTKSTGSEATGANGQQPTA